jgi:hypothetical protein
MRFGINRSRYGSENSACDCWSDDVSVVDSDNGFLLVPSKGITLTRTKVSGRGLLFGNVRAEVVVVDHGGSADAGPLYGREPARGAARTPQEARLAWTGAVENR